MWQNLKDAGIDPAPTRSGQTWRTFLGTRAKTILAGTASSHMVPAGTWYIWNHYSSDASCQLRGAAVLRAGVASRIAIRAGDMWLGPGMGRQLS